MSHTDWKAASMKAPSMKCINCDKPSSVFLCPECVKAGEELERMLTEGIELGYIDGTKEILRIPDKDKK